MNLYEQVFHFTVQRQTLSTLRHIYTFRRFQTSKKPADWFRQYNKSATSERETNATTAHFSFEIVLCSILLQNGKYSSVQPPFQTIENGQMNFCHFNTQCCWLQAETILTWFTFYHAVDVNHSEKFWKSYIIHLCSTKNIYKKKLQRHFLWLNSKHYRTLEKVKRPK